MYLYSIPRSLLRGYSFNTENEAEVYNEEMSKTINNILEKLKKIKCKYENLAWQVAQRLSGFL